jgi:hypothetical protein
MLRRIDAMTQGRAARAACDGRDALKPLLPAIFSKRVRASHCAALGTLVLSALYLLRATGLDSLQNAA